MGEMSECAPFHAYMIQQSENKNLFEDEEMVLKMQIHE